MIIEIILLLLITLFIGYNLGYRKGKFDTKKKLDKSIPLLLKEESLKNGHCILCNREKS